MLFLSDDLEGTSVSGIASSIGIVVSIPSCPVLFSLEGRTWSSSSIREQGPTSSPLRLFFFFSDDLKGGGIFLWCRLLLSQAFSLRCLPSAQFLWKEAKQFFSGQCWSVIISIGLCLLGLPCRSGSLARGCMSCHGFYTSWTALLQCSLGDKSPNRVVLYGLSDISRKWCKSHQFLLNRPGESRSTIYGRADWS